MRLSREKQLIFLSFFLLSIPTHTSYQSLLPYFTRHNVITVRKAENFFCAKTSIAQLVKTIHTQGIVPYHTMIEINNTPYMFHRGLALTEQDTAVTIFSRGYAKTTQPGSNDDFIQRGACAKAAYIQLKDHIAPHDVPLVCFDYDDGRYGFAFGQQAEINLLQTIYQEVLLKSPHAHIILIGDCRGAKVALEVATQQPERLKALILMAPFISGRQLSDQIATKHLSYLPGHKFILHFFFKCYFKNYKEKYDTLATRLAWIDPSIPICIASRYHDELVTLDTINTLVYHLRRNGNPLTIELTQDRTKPHSKVTTIPLIQRAINSFLKEHHLPHNPIT